MSPTIISHTRVQAHMHTHVHTHTYTRRHTHTHTHALQARTKMEAHICVLALQALSAQHSASLASARSPPAWVYAAILFLGWNEFMGLVFSWVRLCIRYVWV